MISVYVEQIENALQNKLYFPALALALTLPDICGNAEYPNEEVGKRYVNWYDKFIGIYMDSNDESTIHKDPYLSGEVVYNLRNTFLHIGSPNIQEQKIKDSNNQFDKFKFLLGDGKTIQYLTINVGWENPEKHPGCENLGYKAILVDITFLCESICESALSYYENNKDKFKFEFHVITQEEFLKPIDEPNPLFHHEWIVDELNKKLESQESSTRITGIEKKSGFSVEKKQG